MVEEHVGGGMVGPTFACIIAKQFRNLRVGDRFWYERPDQYIGFTPGTYEYEYVHTVCGNIGTHQFGRQSMLATVDALTIVQLLYMLENCTFASRCNTSLHYVLSDWRRKASSSQSTLTDMYEYTHYMYMLMNFVF